MLSIFRRAPSCPRRCFDIRLIPVNKISIGFTPHNERHNSHVIDRSKPPPYEHDVAARMPFTDYGTSIIRRTQHEYPSQHGQRPVA